LGRAGYAGLATGSGAISKEKVSEVTRALFELGVDEVSIGDTIGAATPLDVEDTVGHLVALFPASKLAMHFHDTYAMAIANVYASLRLGVTVFDSSTGGIGGCPYAPGATGNVATEKLVYLFDRLKVETGISMARLQHAAQYIDAALKAA